MQQKTLIALAALGVIGIAAYLTMRAPDKGQRLGPPPRPITAFKAADVKELDVTSNKEHVILKHDGSSWKITSPGAWNADQQMCKTATEQLEKLGFGDLVTESAAKFADLEVEGDKSAHVIAKDGAGKVLLDGSLGKQVAGFTMLRPTGKNEVWQATGLFKNTFARDVKTWRDHVIFEYGRDDVTKLEVEAAPGQKLVLEKLPAGADDKKNNVESKWKVIESAVKVDPLDDQTANQLVNALVSLRAASFADEAKPDAVGLQPPRLKITFTAKGAPVTLLVGNTKGDDTWVQVNNKPQIYLVQKWTAERLAVAPMNFRDKTLVKAKDADLVAIDIATGGEAWSLKHEGAAWKPAKGVLDDNKVKGLVSAFENLQGASFVVGATPKETGFDKPTGTATLHLRDKSVVTLKVGAIKDGSDYYVTRAGSPDVLLVKKYMIDRFLKKSADFAKSATPPPPGPGPRMPPHM